LISKKGILRKIVLKYDRGGKRGNVVGQNDYTPARGLLNVLEIGEVVIFAFIGLIGLGVDMNEKAFPPQPLFKSGTNIQLWIIKTAN